MVAKKNLSDESEDIDIHVKNQKAPQVIPNSPKRPSNKVSNHLEVFKPPRKNNQIECLSLASQGDGDNRSQRNNSVSDAAASPKSNIFKKPNIMMKKIKKR